MVQVEAGMPGGMKGAHKALWVHMIVGVEAGTQVVDIDHKPDQGLGVEGLVADTLQVEGSQLEREVVGKAAGPDLQAGKVVVAAHMEWVAELEGDMGHRQLPRHLVAVVVVEGEEEIGRAEVRIVL